MLFVQIEVANQRRVESRWKIEASLVSIMSALPLLPSAVFYYSCKKLETVFSHHATPSSVSSSLAYSMVSTTRVPRSSNWAVSSSNFFSCSMMKVLVARMRLISASIEALVLWRPE